MSSCNISVRHRLRVSFPLSEQSIRNEEFSNDYREARNKRLFSLQWISASGFQLEPVYLRISVWEPKPLSLSRQMHACFGKVVTAVSTNGWVPTTATTIFQVNVQNVPTPLPNVTPSDLSSYITVVSFLPSLLSKVQKQIGRAHV